MVFPSLLQWKESKQDVQNKIREDIAEVKKEITDVKDQISQV